MTESTARAALFELQSSPSPTYIWSVNQKPVVVRIPFPVIDRLEHQAVESFRSLSSKGSEIGGLLYGKVAQGEPYEVAIDDYELITCDYSRGPLYRLSDADTGRFDRSISQLGSGPLKALGYFRSHTRKGLALDAEDLAFFESRFREPHQIVLLVRPFATKASSAGIFFRENGAVHGEQSYLEFPFRSSLLAAGKPVEDTFDTKPPSGLGGALPAPVVPKSAVRGQIVPIASRREISPAIPTLAVEAPVAKPLVEPAPPEPEVEPEPVQAAAPEPPAPERAPVEEKVAAPVFEARVETPKPEEVAPPKVEEKPFKPLLEEKPVAARVETFARPAAVAEVEVADETAAPAPSRKWLWITIGAVVPALLLIAFLMFPMHRNQPPNNPADNSLSLRVERTAGEILLTWNRDSDAIRSAAHAVLSISDGDQHENVEMDLSQLRNGSISYSPATSDVVFKMEVTGKNQEKTASESVRALRTRPSPLAGPDTAQPSQNPAAPGVKAPDASAANQNPAANATANAANANGANTAGAPGAPNGQPDANKPPEPRPLKPFQAPSLSARLHPASASELPDAPVLGGVAAGAPTSVPGLNMGSASAPVAPRPAASAPVPAPAPANPPAEKKASSGGQIQQAVLISKKDPEYPKLARETGTKGVVQLVATIGPDGRVKNVKIVKGPPMLQKAAADAVMQWRYKPTTLNGQPVEAQTEVLVNFLGTER